MANGGAPVKAGELLRLFDHPTIRAKYLTISYVIYIIFAKG